MQREEKALFPDHLGTPIQHPLSCLCTAFLPGREEAPTTAAAGHAYPEDLPRLALPHPLPADAQESDPHFFLVSWQHGTWPYQSSSLISLARVDRGRGGSGGQGAFLTGLWFPQQKKRYGKMKASALLIQAFVRGWKVIGKGREMFLCIGGPFCHQVLPGLCQLLGGVVGKSGRE